MPGEYAADLSDELREWLERRAEESGEDPSELLARAIAAYQLVESEDDVFENGEEGSPVTFVDESTFDDRLTALSEFDDRLATLESEFDERLDALESEFDDRVESLEDDVDRRVDSVETDVDDKIDDVRDRVIQVKRETDAKASADHTHEQLQRALDAAESAEETGERLQDRIERVDRGFENFEDILEYLTDTVEDVEMKLDILGNVAIDLRRRVGKMEGGRSAREIAEELKEEANREGITTAKCGSCESKLQVGLLTTPHCPHCDTAFRELEPAEGLFGSPYLRAGKQPALEGGPSGEPDTPEDLFEEYDSTDDGSSRGSRR